MDNQAYRAVKYALPLEFGETYDVITNIGPVYDG